MDRALINPIDRYEKPVTRIGQQAVGPGTKPTFGWACVLEAELGHFVKCVYKLSLLWFGDYTKLLYASNSVSLYTEKMYSSIVSHKANLRNNTIQKNPSCAKQQR